MTDELQGEEDLVVVARRECWRLGHSDDQTWAVERSALQVGKHRIIFLLLSMFDLQGILCNETAFHEWLLSNI